MEKETLIQYQDLKREIKMLENRIEREENRKSNQVVIDSVKGSAPSFPFQEVTFKIEGIEDSKEARNRRERRHSLLRNRKYRAEQLRDQIEEFIASIPDSKTRQIFEMRYIEQYTWCKISNKFHSRHESYARNIHDRYLEKLKG